MIAAYSAGTPNSLTRTFCCTLIIRFAAFFSASVESSSAIMSLCLNISFWAVSIIPRSTSAVFLLSASAPSFFASMSYSEANAPVNISSADLYLSSLSASLAAWNVWKGCCAALAAVAANPPKPVPVGVALARFKPKEVKKLGKLPGN